jgi:TrmH family RNA methyltransferase
MYNIPMFSVILARPENPENIGLVARAMANTGFADLRLTGVKNLEARALRTAVHAEAVLRAARRYDDLDDAVSDLHLVFAATARVRKNFAGLTLDGALSRMAAFPASTKIGLLFGNERTGLTSEELRLSNFRFTIPQARRQPSYNLAAAVLLTLFPLFKLSVKTAAARRAPPLPRTEQDACIRGILEILERRGFMTEARRRHVSEMIYDLFGRLAMTEKDRRLLLAVFQKGTL